MAGENPFIFLRSPRALFRHAGSGMCRGLLAATAPITRLADISESAGPPLAGRVFIGAETCPAVNTFLSSTAEFGVLGSSE